MTEIVLLSVLLVVLVAVVIKIFFFSDPKVDPKTEMEKQEFLEKNAKLLADLSQKTEEVGEFRQKISFLEESKIRAEAQLSEKLQEMARKEGEFFEQKKRISALEQELSSEKEKRSETEGKGKELFARFTKSDEENKSFKEKIEEMQKKLTQFESTHAAREKEFLEKIEKLENSREKLEKEQHRVIREDEELRVKTLEEKNRIWNNHENEALFCLREMCQKPEFGFSFYENTSLPADFDGKLKPDFLMEFLGQYIVFDAKKSERISAYIADQVKSTAKKYAEKKEIYPFVFFVIPPTSLQELKKTVFFEEGFWFFIIAPEALETVFALLKRIADYERLEAIDPQERENIVQILAKYDRHISFQNAANIVLAEQSIALMNEKEKLSPEMQEKIGHTKNAMKEMRINPSDLKKLSQKLENQEKAMAKLVSPKVSVSKEDLEEASGMF